MTINFQKITFMLLCLVVSSLTYAKGDEYPVHSLTIKSGDFVFDNKVQLVGSTEVTFDVDSSSASAIGYEKRKKSGFAWGLEVTSYKNSYTTSSASGVATSRLAMFNFKKYFKITKHIQPFIGGGVGISAVVLKNDATGGSGGAITVGSQAMAGVAFPFKRVTLILEYKAINAEPEDVAGDTVKISGNGVFAGVAINF